MKLKLGLTIALLAACSSAPKLPACHGETAADIEAVFVADVIKLRASGVCDRYETPSLQCPEYLAREAQFDRDLEAYKQCQR